MKLVKQYIHDNCSLLFKHTEENTRIVIFDNKGFSLHREALDKYHQLKNEPHLYVAGLKNEWFYVGKSFQKGGRWKKQHAYHLGTLAHHLLGTIRYDDQNHTHWIDNWMNRNTITTRSENVYTIELKSEVYISFIPFSIYSNQNFTTLSKKEIQNINKEFEFKLISSYYIENIPLLNVQHNKKID